MKKIYVNPVAQTYAMDHADVLTASGVKDIGSGDLGLRGSDLFGD